MSKYERKDLRPKLAKAQSWRGKKLRDGFTNKIGLVLGAAEDKEGIYLLALFPEDKQERKIYLQPRDDGEFLYPDQSRARYRPYFD
jgi:hypothetical protein